MVLAAGNVDRAALWPGGLLRRHRVFLYAALLSIVNAVVCRDLFTVAFTRYFLSNEGTFIALSRFLLENGPGARWFPWWNGGVPYEYTYLPLLQYVVAAFAWTTHCSPALSFHIVTACFYCLGPVTVFLFLWGVSRQAERSFLVALLYSLWSPSAVLLPEVGAELGSIWGARRLYNAVYWGEAPHVTALTLLPAALLMLYWALTRRRRRYFVGAGILMGAVVLTNAFGAVSLAITTAGLLLTLREPSWRARLVLTGMVGVLAYCWISPLLPPWVIRTIVENGPTTAGDFRFQSQHYIAWIVVLGLAAVLWRLAGRIPNPVTRFAVLLTAIYAAVLFLYYRAGLALTPQPHRYQLELELAVCVLLIFAGADLLAWTVPRWKVAAGALVTLFCIWQAVGYTEFARRSIRPVAPETTIQHKIARWMSEHLPGRRAMVSGDVGFWYNVFSDNPQIGSGQEATNPNRMQQVAVGSVYGADGAAERDGLISMYWLKAFGCHAVTVPGPASGEKWKPIRNVHQFDGLLPVLWRDEDDTIYSIPQRSPSLAHVIPPAAAVSRQPVDALDLGPLKKYVAALDDVALPLAQAQWIGTDRMRIRTHMTPNQVLSVQVTYDPGWHARVPGRGLPVTKDGLGLLLIQPSCSGPCEVDLVYTGRPEAALCRLVSIAVTAFVVVIVLPSPARRKKIGIRLLRARTAFARRAAEFARRPRPWVAGHADALAVFSLVAANAIVIAPHLLNKLSAQCWRNDYVLAAMSRLFRDYVWSWNPLWSCGAPFRGVYPLFHLLVALTPVPIERGYQFWSGLSYLLVPAALYLFARQLFGSRWPAILAAAAYSFLPSPIDFHRVPWPFIALVEHAEIARTLSLAIALAALSAVLRNRWTIASLCAGAVFLLSWPGAAALLIGLAGVGAARTRDLGYRQAALRVLGVAGAGYGLAAFWIPPEFARITSAKLALGPYLLELNLGLVLLGASLFCLLRRRQLPAVLAACAVGLVSSAGFLASCWTLQPPGANPRDLPAARITDWLNRNAAGSRVLAAGELEGAMNLWSDVRQWRGVPTGTANNLVLQGLEQSIASCAGSELAALWMRAVNVPLVVVHGPESREHFHRIARPENFSALPVVWTNGAGDSIRRLPEPELHEAVVVSLAALERLPRLRSADDLDALRAYVDWARGVRPARLAWSRNDTGEIEAEVREREGVLVKTNYDRGWRAAGATVRPDPIGFLLLEVPAGRRRFTLRFGAVWDQWLARAVTLATIAVLLAGPFAKQRAWLGVVAAALAVVAYLSMLAALPPQRAGLAGGLPSAPIIGAGGIVNGGGVPLPLIRGFPIEIYGTNLGGAQDRVRVLAGGREAPILYRSETQVNVRLPEEAPDAVEITVEVNGCRGNAFVLPARN